MCLISKSGARIGEKTMTENGPERWARLDELYHAALEQPEEQRDAFLRSACEGDEVLQREVRALIGFHGHEGFFDKSPAEIAARLQVAIEDPAPEQAAARGVGRLKSSDSIPTGGFTPGVILLGRYRIIGLLGRGGMGEVYRADDLKLGQPVALKFLPPALATDPVRRERFIAEVRITRGLAHPNICRVYDISDFEGRYFLSMEFIDGEDLASLIQRIGYLSNEKALDLARQLAAGLAAAHSRGVLHRDLKPANIMVDGHGRVRITDFGIAVAAGDEAQAAQAARTFGTPAYMAPEQFAGQGATVRSDIYALGLILYEIYSGRKAFTAPTIAELRAQKEGQTPTAPSDIRHDIDPIVERVIMRCLERDPRSRPASAAQLAAALPGGDPLAAAIAAGETPSPEMVAASGLREGLRPSVAWSLLAFTLLGLFATGWLRGRTDLFERLKPSKSPEVLAERAREFIKSAGYAGAPADSEVSLKVDPDFVSFQNGPKNGSLPIPWKNLSSLSPLFFFYRQSPQPLERTLLPLLRDQYRVDPPVSLPGEIAVRLDTEGRLRLFRAIPPASASPAGSAGAADWAALFTAAGLDIAQWTPTEPRSTPEFFADAQAAWQGTFPDAPGIPIVIEAAALQGRPVSFTVVYPWSRLAPTQSGLTGKLGIVAGAGLLIIWMVGPGIWVRRNLRLGRGDRRGANRLVVAVVLVPYTLHFLLQEHHVATSWEVALFVMYVAGMGFAAGQIWMLYIAIEPFVRRRWPEMLVSWTRALSGEWRDPVLGRDLLIGCAVGIAGSWVPRLLVVLSLWLGRPESALFTLTNPDMLLGTRSYIGLLAFGMPFAIFAPLFLLLLYLALRSLLRKDWLTGVAWTLTSPVDPTFVVAVGPWFAWTSSYIFIFCVFLMMRRFGIVALSAYFGVGVLSDYIVTTFDNSWYAGYGYASLALIGALAFYAFRISLGDRPLSNLSPVDSE
jgi:serine/threonine-protein kinase